MSNYILDFESPLREVEEKIDTLKSTGIKTGMDVSEGIKQLEEQLIQKRKMIYKNLSRWERVQLARHPKRPYSSDIIIRMADYWLELHGDRCFSDDPAMVCGIARLNDLRVMIISQEKGRGTKKKVYHNFGMSRPEGYRKALRLMKLAEKYNIPVLTLIDTPGAYPGVGAEQRGQSEAIAKCIEVSLNLKIPTISVIIGEGGSGGAVAIATTNKVLMLEHSVYSVISPEGCASILWKDSKYAEEAAVSMKITAQDLKELDIIDSIIAEPVGGAHRNPSETIKNVGNALKTSLKQINSLDKNELFNQRKNKYLMTLNKS